MIIPYEFQNNTLVSIEGERLIVQHTPFQKLVVANTTNHGKIVLLDEIVQYSETDEEFYHEPFTHVALSMNNPKNVLIIGGGDGGVLREVLKHPVEKVTLVELDELAMKLMREHVPIATEAWKDPRVNVKIGDGIKFMKEAEEKFDTILLDLTDPEDSPSQGIFTLEFFQDVVKKLTPDGFVVIDSDASTIPQVAGRMKTTISKVFKNLVIYGSFIPSFMCMQTFIVATNGEMDGNIAEVLKERKIELRGFTPEQIQDLLKPNPFLREILDKDWEVSTLESPTK